MHECIAKIIIVWFDPTYGVRISIFVLFVVAVASEYVLLQ